VLLAVNLVYGFIQSGISWQAHLGGLLTGLAVTWVFVRLARPRRGVTLRRQEQRAGMVAALMAVAMVSLVAGVYTLLLA
jgi:membrane associated rhomboid family serine protease